MHWLLHCPIHLTPLLIWKSLSFAIVLVATATSVDAVELPFRAVTTAGAAVFSGPDSTFYQTDRLAEGTQVEVYRDDGDGWWAIRPPETSFSWVLAEHLELTDEPTLARVINIPVKTRVGSRLHEQHDVEYISLRQGEIVELLGSKELSDSKTGDLRRWFKIAPPAGEFRWIRAADVRRRDHTTPREDRDPSAARQQSVGSKPIQTFDLPTEQEKQSDLTDQTQAFQDVSEPIRTVSYEHADVADSAEREHHAPDRLPAAVGNHSSELPADSTHVNIVTWEAVAPRHDVLAAPEPRAFRDSYDALNVMLSRAVLDEISQWKLDSVQHQAQLLFSYAQSIEDRELTQALLAKIEEFRGLQRRNDEVEQLGSRPSSHDSQVQLASHTGFAEPSRLPEIQAVHRLSKGPEMPQRLAGETSHNEDTSETLQRHEAVNNSMFDATGILIAVQSRKSDLPQYALTNRDGMIVRLVSASKPAGLRPYLNHHVGILGEVGYLRRFNKPHIVAEQVVRLQR